MVHPHQSNITANTEKSTVNLLSAGRVSRRISARQYGRRLIVKHVKPCAAVVDGVSINQWDVTIDGDPAFDTKRK